MVCFKKFLLFNDFTDPTIEDSYRINLVHLNGTKIELEILDTTGVEQFTAMRELYRKSQDGYIVIYSSISSNTFHEAREIVETIHRVKDRTDVPIVLVE